MRLLILLAVYMLSFSATANERLVELETVEGSIVSVEFQKVKEGFIDAAKKHNSEFDRIETNSDGSTLIIMPRFRLGTVSYRIKHTPYQGSFHKDGYCRLFGFNETLFAEPNKEVYADNILVSVNPLDGSLYKIIKKRDYLMEYDKNGYRAVDFIVCR